MNLHWPQHVHAKNKAYAMAHYLIWPLFACPFITCPTTEDTPFVATTNVTLEPINFKFQITSIITNSTIGATLLMLFRNAKHPTNEIPKKTVARRYASE